MLANQQMQVLEFLSQQSIEFPEIFLPLRKQVESAIKNSPNRLTQDSLPDVSCTKSNESIIKVLDSLVQLGRKAEEDLQNIKRYRQDAGRSDCTDVQCEVKQESCPDEQEELGITGTLLKQEQGAQLLCPEGIFGFNKEPLPEDDSLQQVYLLLDQCKDLLTNLDEENLELKDLLSLADNLMIHLRRYHALLSVSMTLRQPAEEEEKLNQDIHQLFKHIFQLISRCDSQEKENLYKSVAGAWVWEIGPEPSVMTNSTVKRFSLRVYGVDSVDKDNSEAFVIQDKDRQPLSKKPSPVHICENENKGVLLEIQNFCFKDLAATRKRGLEYKLYRFACNVVVGLPESSLQFKCCSLPFLIRTGSPQLWPYISNIVWFIWAQKDMRVSDCSCPKELELVSVLGLIQARIVGAGLRLRNGALWEKMKQTEEGTAVGLVEKDLPHKLTDGERTGWTGIIKQKCGIDQKRQPMVQRQNFTKQIDYCLLWTLVCAAVNTGLHLKKYNLDKFLNIGIGHEMCKSLRNVGPGDFFLRCSLTKILQQAGKEPLAMVVFQVCSTLEVRPIVRHVAEFEKWTLKTLVDSMEWDELGDTPMRWILPDRDDLLNIKEEDRKRFIDYYQSKSSAASSDQFELPQRIVIQKLDRLSLNPGTPSIQVKSPLLQDTSHDPFLNGCDSSPKAQTMHGEARDSHVDHAMDKVTKMEEEPIACSAVEMLVDDGRPAEASPVHPGPSSSEDFENLRILSPADEHHILKLLPNMEELLKMDTSVV